MKTKFKLVGLSLPKSYTCHTDKGDIFWATTKMPDELFKEFFDKAESEDAFWKGNKWEVKIQHNGFYEDGTPKNPEVIEVIQKIDMIVVLKK